MEKPKVTIVVVQSERFSYTIENLEKTYRLTHVPFDLVYVSGRPPGRYKKYLREKSLEKGFKLISFNYYLNPTKARNIGFSDGGSHANWFGYQDGINNYCSARIR